MKTLLTIVLFCSTFFCYSQEDLSNEDNWKITQNLEHVIISQRTVEFNDDVNGVYKEYIQYKFKNKTDKQLFINWDFEFKYSHTSKANSGSDELYRALVLEPNQNFIPDYYFSNQKSFFVFNKFLKSKIDVHLESVNFKNLKTKTL
ncbi:hypothetical protein [Olleya sp. R77988]|uniref:hypothetical protein n=1 Tax=Olleya sp. R77988 TaxID=3093875 RepID=UPI0037CAD9D7